MTDTLIILAAGASSRMKKSLEAMTASDLESQLGKALLDKRHKGLIPLDSQGRTVIHLLMEQAALAQVKRIIFVIQPPGSGFKSHLNSAKSHETTKNLSIEFAYQHVPDSREKPLGTADALYQCMTQFPELKQQEFMVCNGDNVYSKRAINLLRCAKTPNALIGYHRSGLKFSLEKIKSFALLSTGVSGELMDLIEKPDEQTSQRILSQQSNLLVSMNLWKFYGLDLWPALIQCPMHPERLEKELPKAVTIMLNTARIKFQVVNVKEHVPDLTQASDIEQIQAFLEP